MTKYITYAVLSFVAIVLFAMSAVSVDVGERAVIVGFGEIKETLSEGFHLVNPFYDVNKFTIRNTKYETQASSGSKDIQTAVVDVAVNFEINEDMVEDIYRTYGNDYMSQIFRQNVQEAVKSATAQYTASELITKRDLVKADVKDNLQEMVVDVVTITDVAITNIQFSEGFNQSVEAKVAAEQRALQAEAELEQKKLEAQAIKVQAEAIQAQGGAEYVQLKAIERWSGEMPMYYSGESLPFIGNLGK